MPDTLPSWLHGLTHKDWLCDGYPCTKEQWDFLNWSKAWVDLGPSPAGNLGPYWHVEDRDGDCSHRMYPRVLMGKWLGVVHRAVEEAIERSNKRQGPP
jgi:hypothetical protein